MLFHWAIPSALSNIQDGEPSERYILYHDSVRMFTCMSVHEKLKSPKPGLHLLYVIHYIFYVILAISN